MRRRILAVVGAMVLGAVALSGQNVVLTTSDALVFDYSDADFITYQVTRFEASWDGAAFVTASTQAGTQADTWVGYTSYKVTPPFTNGTHTVTFRACNTAGCGGASAPFAFGYLASPASSPVHVRKVTQ